MSPQSEQTDQQPGADRFWGQFSKSQAGRSGSSDQEAEEARTEPDSAHADRDGNCLEWCPICRSAELLRTTVSPELRQQAESIQQEAIGVLKAFLDAYQERSSSQTGTASSPGRDTPGREEPADTPGHGVTDIPLD